MIKKCYLALVFALTSCLCFASATLPTAITPTLEIRECDLPAPTNFWVEDYAPNWVKLFWGPIAPGGPQHRVRTYLTNGNILVNNVIVPANQNTLVVNNLIPGEQYYSRINPVCSDGSDSKYYKDIIHPDTWITELIVTGFSGSGTVNCGVGAQYEYCDFSISNENYFQFRKVGNSSRKFATYKDATTSKLMAKIDPADNSGSFQFKIDGNVPQYQDVGVPGLEFQVHFNGGTNPVGKFIMYYHYDGSKTVGRLRCESMDSEFDIVRLSPAPMQKPPSSIQIVPADRDETTPAPLVFAATPNPFSSALDLIMSQPVQREATIQLLNLSGQIVLNQSLNIGQEQHTLSTEHLLIGFYFLRIEQDGEVQTLKVAKFE